MHQCHTNITTTPQWLHSNIMIQCITKFYGHFLCVLQLKVSRPRPIFRQIQQIFAWRSVEAMKLLVAKHKKCPLNFVESSPDLNGLSIVSQGGLLHCDTVYQMTITILTMIPLFFCTEMPFDWKATWVQTVTGVRHRVKAVLCYTCSLFCSLIFSLAPLLLFFVGSEGCQSSPGVDKTAHQVWSTEPRRCRSCCIRSVQPGRSVQFDWSAHPAAQSNGEVRSLSPAISARLTWPTRLKERRRRQQNTQSGIGGLSPNLRWQMKVNWPPTSHIHQVNVYTMHYKLSRQKRVCASGEFRKCRFRSVMSVECDWVLGENVCYFLVLQSLTLIQIAIYIGSQTGFFFFLT